MDDTPALNRLLTRIGLIQACQRDTITDNSFENLNELKSLDKDDLKSLWSSISNLNRGLVAVDVICISNVIKKCIDSLCLELIMRSNCNSQYDKTDILAIDRDETNVLVTKHIE